MPTCTIELNAATGINALVGVAVHNRANLSIDGAGRHWPPDAKIHEPPSSMPKKRTGPVVCILGPTEV